MRALLAFKAIIAAADGEFSVSVIHANEFHAIRRRCDNVSFQSVDGTVGGDVDSGRRVCRYRDPPHKASVLFHPMAANGAVDGEVTRVHKGEITHGLGPHDDMLKARLFDVGADAG